MKESILKNITQLCLIVFSVVLGLYLSERIEDSKNDKEAKKLLSKIKSELNDNKKILDEWAPYHRNIVKSLDSLSKNEKFVKDFISDKSTLFKVFTKGTIMGETLSNDAWDIAKSHPLIINFEFDDLLILSKIYNQQKITFESAPKLVELLLSTELNSKENARPSLQSLKNMLQDIASREIQLIEYYNNAEQILNLQNNGAQ